MKIFVSKDRILSALRCLLLLMSVPAAQAQNADSPLVYDIFDFSQYYQLQ